MDEVSNKMIGDFELLSIIGDGAQGRVYKARVSREMATGLTIGDLVALKVVNIAGEDENMRRKFQAQADILRRLSHDSIVKYIDSFTWHAGDLDECQCLVMEYLEGEDLTCRVQNFSSGLAWPQVEDIFEKCLAGLIHARECGITHRDLKPSNIYLTKDGKVKLIDFDIARQDDSEQLSTAGWKGTFDYMAPDFITQEGFRGDEISDIFSLGVCFYQALTGMLPYERLGSNAHIGYVNRWHGSTSKPPSFRVGVFRVLAGAKAFVAKALSVNRAERYQSFSEMLEDFRKIHYRIIRHKGKDDYELLALLGRGGFGEVFKARCSSNGGLVAVKHLFSAKQSGRFVKEAKFLQRYTHENLVRYVDFISQDTNTGDKQFFLVMEYLEGMPGWTLRLRIKNEGRLGTDETLKLFKVYLDALHFMHSHAKAIIHRDIKPGNLYAPVGRPEKGKIFDMGVARDVSGTVTVGGVPGTLDYMAPEFADASGDRGSPQSDIYALGLCFYEALTGKPVFERLPQEINSAWTGFITRVRNPPSISFDDPVFKDFPRLVGIVCKSLALNPTERYRSAQAMADDLNLALNPVQESTAEDDPFDDVEVTMATTPGGADVTMGTRPLQGDINDYLNQIGVAEKKKSAQEAKSALIFKFMVAALAVIVAIGSVWLGVSVLTGRGKKTIESESKPEPVAVVTAKSAEAIQKPSVIDEPANTPEVAVVAAPEAKPIVSKEPAIKTSVEKPPESTPGESEQTVAALPEMQPLLQPEAPVVETPAKEPVVVAPPKPKVMAAADYPAAQEIMALIPDKFTSLQNVTEANRAMLLLAENEGKEWKGVPAAAKNKFIKDKRADMVTSFSAYIKESSDRVVELALAGKNTESSYNPLIGLKDSAPLLVALCSKNYQTGCSAADAAVAKKRLNDTVVDITARALNAESVAVLGDVVATLQKIVAKPDVELSPTLLTQFKKVTAARYMTFADDQYKAFKKACDREELQLAADMQKEYLQWSHAVAPEMGKDQLADVAKLFGSCYQQAEVRNKESLAKKTIARQSEPVKSESTEPAVKVTEPAVNVTEQVAPVVADSKGYLEISVSPSSAIIKLNDHEIGAGKVEVESEHNHMIEISSPGYKSVKQFYKVSNGQTRKVDILLQKEKSRSIFGF